MVPSAVVYVVAHARHFDSILFTTTRMARDEAKEEEEEEEEGKD